MRTYAEAYNAAVDRAKLTGCDVGLELNPLFKSYSIFLLPKPENRSGHELRCEVVRADYPKMEVTDG